MKTAGLWMPIVLCGTALFVISQNSQLTGLFPWIPTQTKELVGHLGLYFVIGFFLARYLFGMGVGWFTTLILTANLIAVLGFYDEFHQSFVGDRGVQLYDIMVDLVGGAVGALGYLGCAAVRWLVVKSARRREARLDLLVRHAAVALTVFVFILIPAAVCSVLITDYVRALATDGPVAAQRVLDRYLHPDRPAMAPSGANLPARSASPVVSGQSTQQPPIAAASLNQFAMVAEMLSRAKTEVPPSPVLPAEATAGRQQERTQWMTGDRVSTR